MRTRTGIQVFLALLPLFLFGCDDSAPATSGVSVTPAATTLPVGGSENFTVKVNGIASPAVNWSVQEGAAGGNITSAGVYTAPNVPGTFHVVATSQVDSTKKGSGTVTVQAGNVQGVLQ